MKKTVKLNEAQLHRVIKESVNKVLIEEGFADRIGNWFDNSKMGGAIQGAYQGYQTRKARNDVRDTNAGFVQQGYGLSKGMENKQQLMSVLENFIQRLQFDMQNQRDAQQVLKIINWYTEKIQALC